MAEKIKLEVDELDISSLPTGPCIPQETVIKGVRLAAAYVPYQKLCTLFSPIEGLTRGTIFPELYSPYEGKNKKYKPSKRD